MPARLASFPAKVPQDKIVVQNARARTVKQKKVLYEDCEKQGNADP
jgi:hypothetical protein